MKCEERSFGILFIFSRFQIVGRRERGKYYFTGMPTRNMTTHRRPIEGGLASETPLFEKDSTTYLYKDASVVFLALCCKLLFYDIIMPGFSVLLSFI